MLAIFLVKDEQWKQSYFSFTSLPLKGGFHQTDRRVLKVKPVGNKKREEIAPTPLGVQSADRHVVNAQTSGVES